MYFRYFINFISSVLNEYYASSSFSFSTFFTFFTVLYDFYTDFAAESIAHTFIGVNSKNSVRERESVHTSKISILPILAYQQQFKQHTAYTYYESMMPYVTLRYEATLTCNRFVNIQYYVLPHSY